MPRGPRIDYPGLLHYVIIRGIERKNIFETDPDKKDFLDRIEKVFKKSDAKIYAWVLMSNHAHLLIKIGKKPLSDIMRRLLTGYAISYNKRHKRAGYLYQGRYKSIVCEEEQYLLELVRYIHLNPVRAGILRTIEELDKFRWTGHYNLIGNKEVKWQDTKEILTRFGKSKKLAIKQYKEFILDGIRQGKREDLSGGGLIRSLGGIGKAMLVKGNNRQDV
ncbi:MAG: transposase [bacterium]